MENLGSIALVIGAVVVPAIVVFSILLMIAKQYVRCPSNKVLVVYGKGTGTHAAKCIHGGGVFVVPLLQSHAFLSLEPVSLDVDLNNALSKENIRINVPATFTIAISTEPDIMQNAAQRLLGLNWQTVKAQVSDIILGQTRAVLASLTVQEINQDRDKFLDLVSKNIETELRKIGLQLINVNIKDLSDAAGYIDATGKRAASEAINKARMEVAEQEKIGAIGVSVATREREVQVAEQSADNEIGKQNAITRKDTGMAEASRQREINVAQQVAQAEIGKREALTKQQIAVASLEAEKVAGEAAAARQREINVAQQISQAEIGKKEALTKQQVAVATLEAEKVAGEAEAEKNRKIAIAQRTAETVEAQNLANIKIAESTADLNVRQAEAKRKGEIALAESSRDVLQSEKAQELARLEKTELAQKEIDKRKVEIAAEAEAEQRRRIAKGEADGIAYRYEAEANGQFQILDAKARGYQNIVKACGDQAAMLLMIEQLPKLVDSSVKALQNIKFDKVVVYDGGNTTTNFVKGFVNTLPILHQFAQQAGIKLPEFMGEIAGEKKEVEA